MEQKRKPHLRVAVTPECNFNCVYCRAGGEDGHFLHRKIVAGASKYVKHNGLIILENEVGQSSTLREMLDEKGYRIECTRKNGRGEERVIVTRRIK